MRKKLLTLISNLGRNSRIVEEGLNLANSNGKDVSESSEYDGLNRAEALSFMYESSDEAQKAYDSLSSFSLESNERAARPTVEKSMSKWGEISYELKIRKLRNYENLLDRIVDEAEDDASKGVTDEMIKREVRGYVSKLESLRDEFGSKMESDSESCAKGLIVKANDYLEILEGVHSNN